MSKCIGPINIIPNNNQVVLQDVNQTITIVDNNCCTDITVTQPITNVVEIRTPGIPGPPGPSGSSNTIDTSSFVTTASFNAFTGSYNTGSFTGSFTGSLFGTSSWAISASRAITSSYVTGSIFTSINPALSSSYALTASYVLNGSTINTSSFATTGSNTFIGHQIITGSVYITGSLNANSQVYEISFLNSVSPYSVGDNIIVLDQELITNPNYSKVGNAVLVNSSGLYKIYTQCYLEPGVGLSTAVDLAVFINNNPYKSFYVSDIKDEVGAGTPTYNFSCVANLNTNDAIEFHINAGIQPFNLIALSPLYNVTCSYMTIEKLN